MRHTFQDSGSEPHVHVGRIEQVSGGELLCKIPNQEPVHDNLNNVTNAPILSQPQGSRPSSGLQNAAVPCFSTGFAPAATA